MRVNDTNSTIQRLILDAIVAGTALLLIIVMACCLLDMSEDLYNLSAGYEDLQKQIDILKEEMKELEAEIENIPKEPVVYEVKVTVEDEPEVVEEIVQEPVQDVLWTDQDVDVLTRMLYGEARGVPEKTVNGQTISSKCQQAAVIWTVLNRYDAQYEETIAEVVTAQNQYTGYRESNPIDEELKDLVLDVLGRWNREKQGETDVGRVLPADYLWFRADGVYNAFRNAYKGGSQWTWELQDPYV